MRDSEEKKLVDSIILGDDRAFEKLFERYHPVVYSIVHAIVRNREDVDDLVQEVFMKVLKGLVYFKGESKLSTWIYAVARNHALNYLKRKETEYATLRRMSDEAEVQGADTDLEIIKGEEKSVVREALGMLRTKHRIALELRYMSEKSYEEIAEIMDVPLGTVKTYIHRGKLEMKDIILKRDGKEVRDGRT